MKLSICACIFALTLAACTQGAKEPAADTQAAAPAATDSEAAAPAAAGSIATEEVSYAAGGAKMKGYLAYDKSKAGPRPGVLVVHEWWGHNDYARKRAEMLAGMGYTALAVDMYGDGKQAGHPDDAKKFMTEVMSNMPAARARFEAAKSLIEAHASTDAEKTAAIGYCFGGAVVLNMARAGLDLDGVASFHGNLSSKKPVNPGQIKGKLLVANGDADPFVPAEQIAAFRKEMADAKVDMKFIGYPNAKHAFTNPGATELGKKFGIPLEYNEAADKASWAELGSFLAEVFAG